MYIIIDENKKILMSATEPVGEWFSLPWTETDKEVVRGTDGMLYFKGELPEGVEEYKEEF